MEFPEGRYYFVSDVHLGLSSDTGNVRQESFIAFLDSLPADVSGLFLLGDIFDFWVEYKDEIPSGFNAVLERFRNLTQRGCRVLFFKGNHDYWTIDYFERELGMEIVDKPYITLELNGLKVCMGHGDVMGCNSLGDRMIFWLFRNEALIWSLRRLPRKWIASFGHSWSASSRKGSANYCFDLESSEIRKFAEKKGAAEGHDLFVFGHFHKASSMRLDCGADLFILGDWASGACYLNLSGMTISGFGFPKTNS